MRDPYDILGVDRSATQDEIKGAFRRLASQHHPDKNPGDDSAQQRFKELNAAYQILSDPQKRAAFDRFDAEILIALVDEHDHGVARGLGLQAQESGDAEAVGQIQIDQDDIEPAAFDARKAVGKGMRDLDVERTAAQFGELPAYELLVLRIRVDQQDGYGIHERRDYSGATLARHRPGEAGRIAPTPVAPLCCSLVRIDA